MNFKRIIIQKNLKKMKETINTKNSQIEEYKNK